MSLLKIWIGKKRSKYLEIISAERGCDVKDTVTKMIDHYMGLYPREIQEEVPELVPAYVLKTFEDCMPGTGKMEEAEFWSIKRVARALKISNYNRQMVHWMVAMGYTQRSVVRLGKVTKGYWVVDKKRLAD
jgi:hypothetical protein